MKKVIIWSAIIIALGAIASLVMKFRTRAEVASNFSVTVEDGVKPPAQKGEKAPQFEGITIDGQKFKFEPAIKEKTLVVFWASWCAPCAEETPALIDLSKRHPDWEVVAVSNDSTEREIRDFIKIFPNLMQPNIAIVWDLEHRISSRYGITGLPESFIIDRQGQLLQKFVGPVNWKLVP